MDFCTLCRRHLWFACSKFPHNPILVVESKNQPNLFVYPSQFFPNILIFRTLRAICNNMRFSFLSVSDSNLNRWQIAISLTLIGFLLQSDISQECQETRSFDPVPVFIKGQWKGIERRKREGKKKSEDKGKS